MNTASAYLIDFAIIAAVLIGIARFRRMSAARAGNWIAAAAILASALAIVYRNGLIGPEVVLGAILVGAVFGVWLAIKVNMVQIPAMIAFQHGAGSIAVVLVSFVELTRTPGSGVALAMGLSGIFLGSATLSASMIASGKLAKLIRQRPVSLRYHGPLMIAMLAVAAASGVAAAAGGDALVYQLLLLAGASLLLGALLAIRVGGADMPVLISFLNASAGLAAAFCGVAIGNRLLASCGAVVTSSGSILTYFMCKAMNRSLGHVLFNSGGSAAPAAAQGPQREPEPAAPAPAPVADPVAAAAEAALKAGTVVIVPGYGMAEGQAQAQTVALANLLSGMGKRVQFAIHPVAGRMPGHMHVLLAEADADPDIMIEIDDANRIFASTDLAVIIGACDVVNPAAISVPGTPISGMPILRADEARAVIVCNLDERPGYSGVDNPLYRQPNAILLFGDAGKTLAALLERIESERKALAPQ